MALHEEGHADAEGGDAADLLPADVAAAAQGAGRRESEELHPVSLTDLFASDPDCAAQGRERAAPSRSHLFAGSQLGHELDLRKLQVFVRIRPSVAAGAPHARGQPRWEPENCVHATSTHSIAIAPPEGSQAYKSGDRGQTYSFSRVFERATGQAEYYEHTAAPLVRDLLRNRAHNSVVMAYGITAAGKTFTIEGTREAPGLMPRALEELFAGLATHVEPLLARVSYFEVYNEQIYDLLDEAGVGPLGQRAALRLKEDARGRVFVAGLSEAEAGSAREALALLRRGSRQRQRAETGLNYSSSRSHSILTVTLYRPGPAGGEPGDGGASGDEEGCGEERLGRISFVDLAGSERAQRTGNVGVRLKESVAINSSLMTLGRCLEALRWNQQHRGGALRVVPYRESKVTHLFRDALHGWGQVVLSVNVSPVSRDYDETAHYAALATQIGTIQQAEAPRRTIKAVSPAIGKAKRKAALPPEARGQGGRAKKGRKAAATAAAPLAVPWVGALDAEVAELEEPSPPLEDAPSRGQADGHAGLASERHTDDGPAAAQLSEPQCSFPSSGLEEHAAGEGSPGGSELGTPCTPPGGDDACAALQEQVRGLVGELQAAQERCVLLEAEVREEVAEEMAQLLRDMEESYRQRLEAEVEAVERRAAACGGGGEGAGRRAKPKGGRDAAQQAESDAAAEQLAAACAEAAKVTAELERLREEADGTAAQLLEAQGRLRELQEQAALQQAQAEQRQAEASERAAAAEAELAACQQAAAGAEALLAAARQEAATLQQLLAASQEQAREAEASAAAEQQRAAALDAALAAAQQRAGEAQAAAEAAAQRAARLEAGLAAAQQAADSGREEASQQYEAQLQEAVTQLEANRGMELEMAEEQGERLRKENTALQRRLAAALAALAACGSPAAGPGALAARMAQAAPEGGGHGAGGTPHDVALARARQAAAAEDMAAAAAAGGGTSLPRSRSRFAAGQAEPGGAAQPASAPRAVLAPVPEEEAGQGQPQAAARSRGRPRKVAFAEQQRPEEEEREAAGAQPGAPAPAASPSPPAPPAESRRSRRMTRAAAAGGPLLEERSAAAAPADPPAQLPAERGQTAVLPPDKPRRGRRRTQAAPELRAAVQAQQPDPGAAAAEPAPAGGQEAGLLSAPQLAGAPELAMGAAEQAAAQPALPAEAAEAPVALPKQRRRRGRPAADKENDGGQQEQPASGAKASPMADKRAGGGGGRRRKRLLPSAPLSAEMQEALGEDGDNPLALRQHIARKQQGAAAVGAGGEGAKEKRSRRQTKFYRL